MMDFKYLFLFLSISLLLSISCRGKTGSEEKNKKPGQIAVTDRFEFYSNFWINQHHFLYANADSAQDGSWDDGLSNEVLNKLSQTEKDILKEGIIFYRDSVISYSLLFNRGLTNLKRTLIDFGENDSFEMEGFSNELVHHLNKIKPVYQRYFWEKHHQSNQEILNKNLAFITEYEDQIFERVSALAQQPWKDEKVRVDITYYANWAGGYTSTHPETHVVITSQDYGPEGDWLELLFHEPTHSIISNRSYKVAELISEVSEELDLNSPRNLWHSLLFYFSGIAVQEAFKEEGVDYELYMVRRDVFGNHHEVIFEYMPAYINGETSLEGALEKLITAYNE